MSESFDGKICAFFGHRDVHPPEEQMEAAIRQLIEQEGIHTFWCGGYGSFDACAAQCVRKLKGEYAFIELVLVYAYLPYKDTRQSMFDASIFPDGLELVPKRFAILRRNEWMAKHSNMVLAYVDAAFGGAYKACCIAKRCEKSIINLGRIDF